MMWSRPEFSIELVLDEGGDCRIDSNSKSSPNRSVEEIASLGSGKGGLWCS